jgi:flagellar FliL protein
MAANDEGQAKDKGEKKSKTTLFLAIGIAVAIAVAAIFGVLFFTGGSRAETGKTVKAASVATAVYSLDPFIVNIYDGQDLRYLRIKVEMGITGGEEAKTQLKAQEAPIRDSILTLLSSKTWQDLQAPQGKDQLKQQIMTAVSKIVAPGILKQVYFTDFVVQ